MNGSTVSDRPAVSQTRPPQSAEPSFPIASKDLLKGRREVWIDHQGTLYCLKATSSGRLYLTK